MTEQIHPVAQPTAVPSYAAQPQDHVNASTFTFNAESGPVTVPKFKHIMDFGFVRRNRAMDEQDIMMLALEQRCSEQELAAVDRVGIHEIEEFFKQWQKDSGIKLGESSGS